MPGLLERALLARDLFRGKRTPQSSSSGNGDGSSVASDGVTEEEREELTREIDKLFVERRALVDFGEIESAPRQSGVKLPLIINLLALTVLLVGILSFGHILDTIQASSVDSAGSYTTAESAVLETARKQTEQALSERDARIQAIQRELERLRNQPAGASVPETAASRAREQALARELEALQSTAAAQLDALSTEDEQTNFILTQLKNLYGQVQDRIKTGDVGGALESVSAADALVSQAADSGSQRLTVLLPAVQTGNEAIRQALAMDRPVAAPPAEAGTDSRLEEQVARAEELGRQVESLQQSVAELRDALQTERARVSRLQGELANRNETVNAQNTRITAQNQRIGELQSQLTQRQNELAARNEQLSSLVSSLQENVRSLKSQADLAGGLTESGEGENSILDLLRTKVRIREVAESAPVRKNFPELSGELDSFFARYGDYFEAKGQKAALDQIEATVQRLDALASSAGTTEEAK